MSSRRKVKIGLREKLLVSAVLVLAISLGIFVADLFSPTRSGDPSAANPGGSSDPNNPFVAPTLDLQPVLDSWVASLPSDVTATAMIYNLDRGEIAGALDPDRTMSVASIYKLLFIYSGYRQVESGSIDKTSTFVTTKDYRAGSYTFPQCLDLMIRESYNGCADPIRNDPAQMSRAQAIIDELSLKGTSELGLSSTALDLTKLLELYWHHPDLSVETWEKIKDSMLIQPPSVVDTGETYDWRQGLPKGFSYNVKAYDKVGWEWDDDHWKIYADAAILDIPSKNRHYSVVVLTSGFRNLTPLHNLAASLEAALLAD